MIRACFALGSWQVMTLAAALREVDGTVDAGHAASAETHLVLYETVPASDALKTAMREVAGAVRPWTRTVEAFDLLAGVPRKPRQAELDACIARLRGRLALDHVDELWLCWLDRAAEKLILETWPNARVRLFEDGLTSYLPPQRPMRAESGDPADPRGPLAAMLAPWHAWRDRTLPARRFRRHRSRLDPRHVRRVDGAWMLLADLWPAPTPLDRVPWHKVTDARLRETLAACQTLPAARDFAAPRTPRPAVLVLGQALSRWGAIGRDDEAAVYAQAVERAVERGYDVWWKEHPRALQPFFGDVAARAPPGRVRRLELPFALPVELVAGRLAVAACIAGFSAALYYLQRLHGIPGFTFAEQLAPFIRGQWALQNEMVRRTMPPLRLLPAAADVTPIPLPP